MYLVHACLFACILYPCDQIGPRFHTHQIKGCCSVLGMRYGLNMSDAFVPRTIQVTRTLLWIINSISVSVSSQSHRDQTFTISQSLSQVMFLKVHGSCDEE